jgi:paraquat-inducible protein B
MKITKEILQKIVKEEIESVLNEMSLNEQERSRLRKAVDPANLIGRGQKFVQRFKSTQTPRYKSRAQAQAALNKATEGTLDAQLRQSKEFVDTVQYINNVNQRVKAIEKKLGIPVDGDPV